MKNKLRLFRKESAYFIYYYLLTYFHYTQDDTMTPHFINIIIIIITISYLVGALLHRQDVFNETVTR